MEKNKDKANENKRLKLVEHYDVQGDYSDREFEIGQKDVLLRREGNWHHPGVSGKSEGEDTWVNKRELRQQKNFAGYGPKNYKRSDDRIYEDVCEALMRSHEVDASNIGVKVEQGVVYLSGKVEGARTKSRAEIVAEDLPGVLEVKNELIILEGSEKVYGPQSVTKNDLGIN